MPFVHKKSRKPMPMNEGIHVGTAVSKPFFTDPKIDVIYNSFPNLLHAHWTIKALRAVKQVLCEKQLGLTAACVNEMLAAVQENNCGLTEEFMYRHHPQTL